MKHDIAWEVIRERHGWPVWECPSDRWSELSDDEREHLNATFYVDFPDGCEIDNEVYC